MNVTEKYVKEYKDAFSLRRTEYPQGAQNEFFLDSVFKLLKHRLVSLVAAILQYAMHLWKYRAFIKDIFKQQRTGKGRDVLIMGNGPSQGLLDLEFLEFFSKKGNDTIAVNYWHLNKKLSKHIPTYMVFSDPASFNESLLKDKAMGLVSYLSENEINIVAPVNQITAMKDIKKLKNNKFYGFIDVEFKGWNNIHPAFPRGYVSMTMYKMLAWAIYKGYDNIYIIGMDNTYIRSLYNDHENKLWNLESHAGGESYLHRLNSYSSVASRLQDLLYLFSDLRKFKQDFIYNIDPYSLVDQFEKKDLISSYKKMQNEDRVKK